MSMTKEQQQALDDALVLREQRLTIGSCNYRLSTTFKPKEPTFQVALDVLTLTPFYPDFLITASVPTEFVDPPFEEDILTIIRELRYSGNIKLLSDVKVDMLPQLWRTFGTFINKCLSAYKTYHDLATGKVQPKPKYVCRSSKTKSDEAPKPSSGKRVKATTKKSSEEEDDDEENVSEHEDDDDDERTKSDNDGDDFVHPKFLTHNEEEGEEEIFDPRVRTPSHVESTDDENDDEEVQEGRHVEMTDDQPTNVQITQVIEDTHVIITPIIPEGQQQSSSMSFGFISNMLNPRPDAGIDSIFTLNTEATSLVDVPVTTTAEPPLMFAITLPPLPTPLTHMQQTPVPTPTIGPSSSL
ncbi:hypothetical protein Tco_0646499 [Tanacetum coccineum]